MQHDGNLQGALAARPVLSDAELQAAALKEEETERRLVQVEERLKVLERVVCAHDSFDGDSAYPKGFEHPQPNGETRCRREQHYRQ
jgi:hypothetical protein